MFTRTNPGDPEALLTEIEASDVLSLSSRTLQAWRVQSTGPAFIRAGRAIRYRRRDLMQWIAEQTVTPQRQRGASRG